MSEGRLGEIECVWWSLLVSVVSGFVFGCLERCLSVSMLYAGMSGLLCDVLRRI